MVHMITGLHPGKCNSSGFPEITEASKIRKEKKVYEAGLLHYRGGGKEEKDKWILLWVVEGKHWIFQR